jgi:RNA 2',3'-cyclic 3'-phosphodiesterase
MPRVFFALWPDTDAAARLHMIARNWHEVLGGRVMREDSLHATLAFIGDVAPQRLPDLCAVADGIRLPGMRPAFDRGGCWRHNRIAYMGMRETPEALRSLQSELVASLRAADFSLETRPFSPHITLLRKANCLASDAAAEKENPATEPVIWSVRDFVLVMSSVGANGSRYEQIGAWPLL